MVVVEVVIGGSNSRWWSKVVVVNLVVVGVGKRWCS